MPGLSHFWQRFVFATALVFGLVVGVAATIFAYSNTATVTVGFSILHAVRVPLWSVAIVPLALVLAAALLFHWWNNLRHLRQHMRHQHRVHELETEVAGLRAHLDQLLEMPDGAQAKPVPKPAVVEPLPVDTKPESISAPAPTVPVNGEEPPTEKAS